MFALRDRSLSRHHRRDLSMPESSRRPLEAVIHHQAALVARCELQRGRYVIGHDATNDFVVQAPSISPKHARLTVVNEGQFFLEDLDSEYGTFVDGVAIDGITPLTLDSRVQLAEATLQFQRGGLPATVFQFLPDDFLSLLRYDFGEVVVEGSTSVIYQARDTAIGREVALKMMRPETQVDPAQVLRFVRDAQIGGQLQHSGILPIYELGLDDENGLFYTTRFVEGEPLGAILDRLAGGDDSLAHSFPLPVLVTIFQRACDVVAYAHTRGVVHSALRPDAITVGAFGEVFVSDWSYARTFSTDESLVPAVTAPVPVTEPMLSTFSSPEQAEGAAEDIEPRTDVHALGGILYKMLTLTDPLSGGGETELLEQALTAKVIPPAELTRTAPAPHWPGGRLPEGLAAIAMKALALQRHDRHESVLQLQSEVAAWQHGAAGGDLSRRWKQLTGVFGKH